MIENNIIASFEVWTEKGLILKGGIVNPKRTPTFIVLLKFQSYCLEKKEKTTKGRKIDKPLNERQMTHNRSRCFVLGQHQINYLFQVFTKLRTGRGSLGSFSSFVPANNSVSRNLSVFCWLDTVVALCYYEYNYFCVGATLINDTCLYWISKTQNSSPGK